MRYHVYTDARHPLGPVAAGHSLHVYNDAAGTVTSSIYAAESGGSPLANPYVVPATGTVDFWTEVPAPHVVAEGDDIPRPMPVVMSPGENNNFAAAQTIRTSSAARQLILVGDESTYAEASIWFQSHDVPIGEFGSCVDSRPEAAVPGTGFLYMAVSADGGSSVHDCFAVGAVAPHRIAMGSGGDTTINLPGQPYIKLIAHNSDMGEQCTEILMPHSQAGNVLGVRGDWSTDPPIFNLNANGDIRVAGALILKDGTNLYAVTVVGGVLTTKLVARNYCTNPSFELDSNADGKADGWTFTKSGAGTPTYSLVAPLGGVGAKAQRIQYTGVAGDAGANFDYTFATVAGTFAAGEFATCSVLAKGALTGAAATMYTYIKNAAGGTLRTDSQAITLTGSPTRLSMSGAVLPANTSKVNFQIYVSGIDVGDTVDITADDVLIQKSATATPYFDGDSKGCQWAAAEHSSESYRG